MAIRQIREYGDEILRKKAREVEGVDDKIRELIEDMICLLYTSGGKKTAKSKENDKEVLQEKATGTEEGSKETEKEAGSKKNTKKTTTVKKENEEIASEQEKKSKKAADKSDNAKENKTPKETEMCIRDR